MNDSNEWLHVEVEAEITLLPTEALGRKSGITSGYRPNHNFGDELSPRE